MVKQSRIIEMYQRLSDYELIDLARKPADLRQEVVPLLAAELRNRLLVDVADELENKVAPAAAPAPGHPVTAGSPAPVDLEAVHAEVTERLQHGESIESIKVDFQERGIDIFNVLNSDVEKEDVFFNRLTDLKREGADAIKLQQHIMQEKNISEQDAELVVKQLKTRGARNMLWGGALVLAGLGLLLYSANNSHIVVIPYGAMLVGIVTFIKGCVQNK